VDFFRGKEYSLRCYGDDYCVIARRDGSKRVVGHPLSQIIGLVTKAVGLDPLLDVAGTESGDLMNLQRSARILSAVRDELRLLKERGPVRVKTVLNDVPGFAQYVTQTRIPLIGMCEITYKCNLRCVHCYVLHKVTEERPAHVNTDRALETVRELHELGCLDFAMSGGEPTLHKDYREIISFAKSLYLYTTLKTNGTTFTRRMAEAYATDPAHETHLSLYGAGPGTHDSFTAIAGSFDHTLRGMVELSRVAVRCKVNCTVWRGNVGELGRIQELVESLGHFVVFDDIIHGRLNGDRTPLDLRISPQTRGELVASGRLQQFTPAPCSAGKMKVKIDAENHVTTCELLPQSVGDISREPLSQIWSGRSCADLGEQIVSLSVPRGDRGRICAGLNFLNTGQLDGETSI
jgi:MoaA/NifB/PqqE/SkfB family radical SAM enzyme